nr:MAG TPA: hypothetical protein [Caudoviricetes sp.]
MKKIRVFPAPHVELKLHVSDQISADMSVRGGKTFEKDQSIPGTARGVKAACV